MRSHEAARAVPALAGLIFAVLYVVALVMVPPLPGVDEPGDVVRTHLVEHASSIRVQALLVTLGTLMLVVVLGYARTRLDGPGGQVFTIGSAALVAEVGIEMWFTSGLALHAATLEGGTARVLADVTSMWGPILTVADVMVAVPIAMAARSGRLPRWLGVLAAVFAVEQVIETVTIVGAPGSFVSPGGLMNFYVGGPLFIVFFLALGIAVSPPRETDG
jgi:hypothetical protein